MLLLDLSRREISVSQLRKQGSKNRVDFLGSASVLFEEWSEPEGDQLISAIEQILLDRSLDDDRCAVLLRPELVEYRELTLPYISDRDLEGMVRFEVKKSSPHKPVEEMAYLYQIIERDSSMGNKVKIALLILPHEKIQFLVALCSAMGLKLSSLKALPFEFLSPLDSGYGREVLLRLLEKADFIKKLPFWIDKDIVIKLFATLWVLLFIATLFLSWQLGGKLTSLKDQAAMLSSRSKDLSAAIADTNSDVPSPGIFYLQVIRWISDNMPEGIWLGKLRLEGKAFEVYGWGQDKETVDAFIERISADYATDILFADWEEDFYKFRLTAEAK